jgi:hypothetical protein
MITVLPLPEICLVSFYLVDVVVLKFKDCHYNFAKLDICHLVPHVIDSCEPHVSVRYQWHISNFAKL